MTSKLSPQGWTDDQLFLINMTRRDETLNPKTQARRTDPETSHEAARSIQTGQSESHRRVLHLLGMSGDVGMTDAELLNAWQRIYGRVPESTPRKRRCDLVRLGKIVEDGKRMIDGRRRIVWKVQDRFW